MANYRRNHYVPEWYQRRFLRAAVREQKFFYLDLRPDTVANGTRPYRRTEVLRWGPRKCFCEEDLYTTRFGSWESTEIEEKFFGEIDLRGCKAVAFWSTFTPPSINNEALQDLMLYMSTQKLRTPKGLAFLGNLVKFSDKNLVLFELQRLRQLFCATWVESIWSLVDASRSSTKFIISDHPVTVYNRACLPLSKWCCGCGDPDIWLTGSHTLFPLDTEKMLVFTNLSWVRNPYSDPLKPRPNPNPFRGAMFHWMQLQTGRHLTETEVCEVNYVIKRRAYRYIAAASEGWLYPEAQLPTQKWDNLGQGYLFMPVFPRVAPRN